LNIKDIFYKWSYFFSNALGISVYINLNNILYKEHVISGGKLILIPTSLEMRCFFLSEKYLKLRINQRPIVWIDWNCQIWEFSIGLD
jgi:hypothetical protein